MIAIFDLRKDNSNETLAHTIKNYYMESNNETELKVYNSNDTNIKDCIGCWSCWWKSPGICVNVNEFLYQSLLNLFTSSATE